MCVRVLMCLCASLCVFVHHFLVDQCKFAHLNEEFIHDVNILYESNVYIFILA